MVQMHNYFSYEIMVMVFYSRATTAGKAPKVWALPRFWVSIRSYKTQPVKKILGRVLDLAWLKFAVAALAYTIRNKSSKTKVVCVKKKVCYKYEKNSGSCLGVTGLDWLCYFAGKS